MGGAVEQERMGRLIENGTITHCIWEAFQRGESSLSNLPGLVKRCIREECWRERYVEQIKEVVTFNTFEAFITTEPPEGLGTDLLMLKDLCRSDKDAADLIDKATARKHGGDRSSKIDNVNLAPVPNGNSKDAALRRLRKDRPDLHQEVLAGKKSPHAAMVEAGFRKVPTPLDALRRAWAKASKSERQTFLDEAAV